VFSKLQTSKKDLFVRILFFLGWNNVDTAIEHEKEIRVTRFIKEMQMIVTCSDDKYTNFWVPPRSWTSLEKEETEEEENEVSKK